MILPTYFCYKSDFDLGVHKDILPGNPCLWVGVCVKGTFTDIVRHRLLWWPLLHGPVSLSSSCPLQNRQGCVALWADLGTQIDCRDMLHVTVLPLAISSDDLEFKNSGVVCFPWWRSRAAGHARSTFRQTVVNCSAAVYLRHYFFKSVVLSF